MSVTTNERETTLTCGFYNGADREYDAEQMASIFDGVIRDGIYESIGDRFVVTTSGTNREVVVGTGRAWLNHTWTLNDDPMILECGVADPLSPRIDAVVIEVNKSESVRDNFIKIVEGTAGTRPTKPELSNGPYVYQYPLCYIYRQADSDVIRPADITNCVGEETPFVTGILVSRSISDLLTRWQADLDDFVASEKADMDTFMTIQEEDFNSWYAERQTEMQSAIDETDQWSKSARDYFTLWFDDIQAQLDTNAAGNLQNQIDEAEIKRLLTYGLENGTKTISEDGRTITYIDTVGGFKLTKNYRSDFLVSNSTLIKLYEKDDGTTGEFAIGTLTKRFSADGLTITTSISLV